MKKLMNKTAEIKMQIGVIWIGMFALYMVSKTLLGIYEVSFLTVLELVLSAMIIGFVKMGFDSKVVLNKLSNKMILLIQYLVISIIMIGLNQLFDFYIVHGIEYLYLQGFITFSYCGAILGFYIMDYYDVNILNMGLKEYKESN